MSASQPDNLADVLAAARALTENAAATGGWSAFAAVSHCAQSIELSVQGYPELKPAWFRATVGPLAAAVMLGRGRLGHDVTAPIPGADPVAAEGALSAAVARLEDAIADFEQAQSLAPHFAFGALSRPKYERIHALHWRDHFATRLGPDS